MRRLFPLLLIAFMLAGCTPAIDKPALMGDEPVVMSFPSPDYGIHAFLWWKPDTALRDLGLINDMGFTWVKQKFPWREIEGIEKGKFDWYRTDYIVDQVEKAGLKLLVRLDRQPFWSEPLDNQWQENGPPGDPADCGD
ncbi:MAG TPA: beta-galactosidase, partial [Promineifilum sp.]|nr:beta-galactosidase [Promineifilum sp.]